MVELVVVFKVYNLVIMRLEVFFVNVYLIGVGGCKNFLIFLYVMIYGFLGRC